MNNIEVLTFDETFCYLLLLWISNLKGNNLKGEKDWKHHCFVLEYKCSNVNALTSTFEYKKDKRMNKRSTLLMQNDVCTKLRRRIKLSHSSSTPLGFKSGFSFSSKTSFFFLLRLNLFCKITRRHNSCRNGYTMWSPFT